LSCIYRFRQNNGQRFGAGHLIDVLRGKLTDKVGQFGHQDLSTFGVGADVSEARWRGVLRQLIALGHLRTEGEYNTLELTASARDVLRGEVTLLLRESAETPRRGGRVTKSARPASRAVPPGLDEAALQRFAALKAWRAEVARAHNLPAFVVFHDATLAEMARVQPADRDELGHISGVGMKKLDAYGGEILRVLSRHDGF
jgi:ATP-dependent DNA helicase RecQ